MTTLTSAPSAARAGRVGRPRLRLPENGKVRAGLLLLALLVAMGLFGSLIADALGLDPTSIDAAASLQPPSGAHPLGTTQAGQDVLAQLLVGAHTSLLVGLVAGVISTTLSVLAGVSAAYLGGWVDALLSACTNVFMVLPGLPLLIIIASYVRGRGSWLTVALIIGLTGWPWGARQKRAQTLSLRQRDFVMAAETLGESRWRIITTELIPNLAPLISTSFLSAVVASVFADAGLAFIGAGNIQSTSWGSMLYWAQSQSALVQGAWWWFVPPGACIALLGTAAGLINFGVDELSNPRLRAVTRLRGRGLGLGRKKVKR